MTDKVQKIRDKVEKLKSQLLRGACSSQVAMETRCKEEAYNEVLAVLDTMQEEPVSDSLEKAATKYAQDKYMPVQTSQVFKAGANWQEEQMMAREEMIEKAIKWVEYNNENGGCKFDGWVENIKQAMKDGTTKR